MFTSKPNIFKEEFKALRELRRDESWVLLTADKGVAMFIFNKQDYINKVENLLEQTGWCCGNVLK